MFIEPDISFIYCPLRFWLQEPITLGSRRIYASTSFSALVSYFLCNTTYLASKENATSEETFFLLIRIGTLLLVVLVSDQFSLLWPTSPIRAPKMEGDSLRTLFFSPHYTTILFFCFFFLIQLFLKFHFQKAGSYYSNQYNLGSNRHTATAPEVSVGPGVMIHSNRDPRKLQAFKSRAAVHMVKVLRHSYENAPA